MSGGTSSNSSHPQATPQQIADAYNRNLPSMLQTTVGQSAPTATTLAGATAAANPIYTASGLQQLQQYAPGYQQAGANLANAQAGSTADLIGGQGGQAALMANQLNNYINPAQAASNNQATNLVNSINLNGLSGGEQAAVERSLNQSNYATGQLGIDNATNAVSNAMNFGNALQSKRTALGAALGAAGGVAANQNAALNGGQFAVNAGNTANNFGLGTFAPTQGTGAGNAALNFGSSIFGGLSSVGASQRSSGGSAQGGVSCYLTTACCEHKGLPNDCKELTILRAFRDKYVPKSMIEEYYAIAPKIVAAIDSDTKRLDYIYNVITACVKDIEAGNNVGALTKYTDMVRQLRKELWV